MDLDLNLREEAPSHGPSSGGPTAPQPPSTSSTSTASSSTSTATREALDEELASRSVADDQRARYGAFSAAAAGEGPSDAALRAAAAFQASTYGTAPGDQPAVDTTPKPGELSAGPSATAERMPVPLQPRPTAYAQFQAGGGGGAGTSGLGVPLRPAAGKARSNSWSYPASAVAPYAIHPFVAPSSSTAGATGIGTGMPAPGPAQPRTNRTTSYRQRGGSLSFSSPDEAMRQQYLQQQQQQQQQGPQMFLHYSAPQPTSQPQPMMAQDSAFLAYGGSGGGVGDGGGFLSAYQQSRAPQPMTAAQATPPLPTTPSSFIRRTSLPQTYLHTIPISRSASSGFTPASTDTALPITAQPQVKKPPTHATRHDTRHTTRHTTHAYRLMVCGVGWLAQTTEVHQKLEIPTHGARALPKEIATHPAIQSITKYTQWAPWRTNHLVEGKSIAANAPSSLPLHCRMWRGAATVGLISLHPPPPPPQGRSRTASRPPGKPRRRRRSAWRSRGRKARPVRARARGGWWWRR
jgi:hypothetical protein